MGLGIYLFKMDEILQKSQSKLEPKLVNGVGDILWG